MAGVGPRRLLGREEDKNSTRSVHDPCDAAARIITNPSIIVVNAWQLSIRIALLDFLGQGWFALARPGDLDGYGSMVGRHESGIGRAEGPPVRAADRVFFTARQRE
jgi:hypothetical protein